VSGLAQPVGQYTAGRSGANYDEIKFAHMLAN